LLARALLLATFHGLPVVRHGVDPPVQAVVAEHVEPRLEPAQFPLVPAEFSLTLRLATSPEAGVLGQASPGGALSRTRYNNCLERGDPLKVDLAYLRRHFASLSDEALRAVNRAELVDAALKCYDEEVAQRQPARRQATAPPRETPAPEEEEQPAAELAVGASAEPGWMEKAACVCTFVYVPEGDAAVQADEARQVLEDAGIPCRISLEKSRDGSEYRVLVPDAHNLEAVSILDREIFNSKLEAEWRAHFEVLSDDELHALDPEVICEGLLDRAERLRRAYEDELNRRGL
jgi:hypothetical protein